MRTRDAGVAGVAVVAAVLLLWLALGAPDRAGAPSPDRGAPAPRPGDARRPPASSAEAAGRDLARPRGDDRRPGEVPAGPPGPVRAAGAAPAPDGGLDAGVARQRLDAFLAANAAAAARHVDRFCAETRAVAALRGYGENPRRRDAAVYLSGRTDWEGGQLGTLHLPAPLVERMRTPELNWRAFGPADYQGLDFGWLTDLQAFDHWSLSGDGPLRNRDAFAAFEAPLPNFLTLVQWAKLRLVKGRNEHDLAQASAEVRHLGDLIASTGSLVGEMIRSSLYTVERGVWESSGLVPAEPPPSAEDVARIRTTSFAAVYFLYPGVPPGVREKALGCVPARCTAISEAMGAAAMLRGVSPDASGTLAWLRSQPGCDQGIADRIVRGPAMPSAHWLEDLGQRAGVEPWMRQVGDAGLD